MVSLPQVSQVPEISKYSSAELEQARKLSPAIHQYLEMINTSDLQSLSYEGGLRVRRHQAWVRASLASIFAKASVQDVGLFWSKQAELLLYEVCRKLELERLGVSVWAFGKLGSEELNLSSDIDLVYISEQKATEEMTKALRSFHQIISTRSENGFCFRIDTDLRPGGKSGPLTSTASQWEDYYWSQASTWERLAMVRFRSVFGPASLLQEIFTIKNKYAYRKYSDYTFYEDLRTLRKKIHTHARRTNEKSSLVNIKLDPGGIRDLELFVHSLQIIHGGRIPSLQTNSIDTALATIDTNQLLPTADVDFIRTFYWQLRHLENLIQLREDQQTYMLDIDQWPFDPKLLQALQQRMNQADRLVSSLLGEYPKEEELVPEGKAAQEEWLTKLGFSKASIESSWFSLADKEARSLHFQRDESVRRRFLYKFVNELAQNDFDRDLGLALLNDFIGNTRAKTSFYTLLLREDRLRTQLVSVFGRSPYIGGILASRPELLDSFVYRATYKYSEDLSTLLEQLVEARQLAELVCASNFLENLDVLHLTTALSDKADEICKELLVHYEKTLNAPPLEILALGKWGSRELGLRSDVDFAFVTKAAPTREQFKVAQRFVARLTEAHRGGTIYPVDLRLRPSGSSGPLIVSIDNLQDYLANKAQAWELQSYLRARWVRGDMFPDDFISKIVASRTLNATDLESLKDIRKKLLKPTAPDVVDLKLNPGGLVDIELSLQTVVLLSKPPGAKGDAMSLATELGRHSSEHAVIFKNLNLSYKWLRILEQLLRIFGEQRASVVSQTSKSWQRIARRMNESEEVLMEKLRMALSENESNLKALDPTKQG